MNLSPAWCLLTAALLMSCDERQQGAVYHGDEADIALSRRCAECHQKEYQQWLGSDHAHAARKPSAADAEAFSGQEISAHGLTLRAEQGQGGALLFREMGSGRIWPVDMVIGRRPMLQFAVRGARGAEQVPSAAWDVTKKDWFDVFADDERMKADGQAERKPGEWGHWQGRGMVWNAQCAWCHMSGYHKNYDEQTDAYASSAVESGVTCVACHRAADKPSADGCLVAPKDRTMTRSQHQAVCASCHARREELDDNFAPGEAFEDHFRLELPKVAGVFYPNGVQREEDYCETGFRISRMGATGVTCYDCHDPHSGDVIAPIENNALCLRCHATHKVINGRQAPYVDPRATFLCPRGSKGHRCVECHMPESTYMGRDPRRDHSLMPPDPVLSRETGVPLACLNCHADKGFDWCEEHWRSHYGDTPWMEKYRPRIRAVAAAMKGQGSEPDLLAALEREEIPAWRAVILGLLAEMPESAATRRAAEQASRDADPMVRAAAAALPGGQAQTLLRDPLRAVRQAAGWQLFPAVCRDPRALRELTATAQHQSDQPTGAMQLAMLAAAQGDPSETEREYRRALALDPGSAVAMMDYAVFLAQQNRPAEALQQMLSCTAAHPELAEAQYRLGLILAELGRPAAARRALEKALRIDPNHQRAAEVLRQLKP